MFKLLRHFSLTSAVAILAFVIASVPARGEAAEVISGPITADVVRVYEGDTLIVHAHPWPSILNRDSPDGFPRGPRGRPPPIRSRGDTPR